ncbi:MAG: methyltransferase domain-containing protein [Candidatus Neomarinimicrobiota bacterium]
MSSNKERELDNGNSEDEFQFWEDIYLADDAGWDLKGPTPIFIELAKEIPIGNLCIIGCGLGYDAIIFAKKGFNVTAVDFAPTATLSLKKMADKEDTQLNILQRDIFTLFPDYKDSFDYVIEQTCFCAIHPSRRNEYENMVRGILRRGGHIWGLWFPLDKFLNEGGPPYGTSIDEVKSIFYPNWKIIREEFPEHSIKPRKGREKLIVFKNMKN